jgi:hypothetical protein
LSGQGAQAKVLNPARSNSFFFSFFLKKREREREREGNLEAKGSVCEGGGSEKGDADMEKLNLPFPQRSEVVAAA